MLRKQKTPNFKKLRAIVMADRTGLELFRVCFVMSRHVVKTMYLKGLLHFPNTTNHSTLCKGGQKGGQKATLTSTLPVYTVQKPKYLISNLKHHLAPISDFGGFPVLSYKK